MLKVAKLAHCPNHQDKKVKSRVEANLESEICHLLLIICFKIAREAYGLNHESRCEPESEVEVPETKPPLGGLEILVVLF